jgi:hypothetical protein
MAQVTQRAVGFSLRDVDIAKVTYLLFAVFLLSDVFNGALRWAFSVVGATPLIYLPKLALLLFPLSVLILQARAPASFLLVFAVFIGLLPFSYANLPTVYQGIFGIWSLVPFLYGCWASETILQQAQQRSTFIAVLLLSAIFGVLLNMVVAFPWVGLTLNVGGTTVVAASSLADLGITRYGGFANVSFTAAGQILALAIWVMAYLESAPLAVLLWLLCGTAIIITTTKGMILTYLILTGYFLTRRQIANALSMRVAWCAVLFTFLLLDILLPLFDLVHPLTINYHSVVQKLLLESFGARLSYMWPGSFSLLQDWTQWLSGRGIGGLGDAQTIFEPNREYAGDNIFVYMTVNFGLLLTIGFLAYFTLRVAIEFLNKRAHPLAFPFAMLFISYGLVVPIIDWPTLSLVFGLIFGSIFQANKRLKAYS